MEQIGIELEQAVELILNNIQEMERIETVFVKDANGRILGEDIYAPLDNPPFHRSPLDGFALCSKDLLGASPKNPKKIRITDTVYAGGYSQKVLSEGKGVRIMTGAPIPEGADCVIRFEDIEDGFNTENKEILVEKELKEYENFCFQGEDVKKGTLVLKKGIKLTYIEQGVLSSMGFSQVTVYDKLKAVVFAVGDEIEAPGRILSKGKIYDSNLFMISARLHELGITPIMGEYLVDEPKAAARAIEEGCAKADIVITTGGVSVGDKDIFHAVLPELKAKRIFWKVRVQPGTPAMFAVYQGKPMFHLSGNPFAAAATFEVLVRPALFKATRDETLCIIRKKAVLEDEFLKKSKSRRLLRGKVCDGKVSIPSVKKHASGVLASMSGCNCILDIPAGSEELYRGSEVEIILL